MVNIKIPVEIIAHNLTKDDLNTIMAEFSDNDLMDCIVHQDKERADWIITNRMIQFLAEIANCGIESEIEDALENNYISKDTYAVFKLLKEKS